MTMDKREVLAQGSKVLNEMIQTKEKYCKIKEKFPFAFDLFDCVLSGMDSGGCCVITLVAIPCLIIWQLEKALWEKKASKIMLPAQTECKLYLQYLQEYLKKFPDGQIVINASAAFVKNSYIGTLEKEKIIFGLFKTDEDWRVRSIEMAIEEIKNHLQLLDAQGTTEYS